MTEPFRLEELELAKRNHGLPLEALRYPVTPPGLHFVLVHYDVPAIDPASWRLSIRGLVDHPRELSLEELEAMPAVEATVTLECAGNGRGRLEPRPFSMPWLEDGIGTARWKGTPLRPLLDGAGIRDEAVELVFSGPDRGFDGGTEQPYERSLTVREALESDALLAYEMNGAPLPREHGFPLRVVAPGKYGMKHPKWLTRVTLIGEEYFGYWQQRGWDQVAQVKTTSIIDVPVVGDVLAEGWVQVRGIAFAGDRGVSRVEVSTDGGRSWGDAALTPALSRWSWVLWQYDAFLREGGHVLLVRATDGEGATQEEQERPSLPDGASGYHRVRVRVTAAAG